MRATLAPVSARRSRIPHAFAAATLILTVACTAGGSTPTAVALAELATDEHAYLGETVQVVGTVRVFGEEPSRRHYVIEDRRQHRVALVPGQDAAGFVGRRVEVVGRFDFSDTTGRLIRLDIIEPVAAPAPQEEPSATARHHTRGGYTLG